MTDSASGHQEWLEELAAASKRKQESFMSGIAEKLRRPRVLSAPEHPYRGAPDFWNEFSWTLEERLERFTANFQAAGGHVLHLPDMNSVKQFIIEKAGETGALRLLRQNQPELAALELEIDMPKAAVRTWNDSAESDWKAAAAESDIGIVLADYAAAYTGSMVFLSAGNKGRSVSLLPAILIAVIPVERVKTRLGEIMQKLDGAGRAELPAGVHFVSGPSRSADIENDLTIGVHGPGIVYALLVDKV